MRGCASSAKKFGERVCASDDSSRTTANRYAALQMQFLREFKAFPVATVLCAYAAKELKQAAEFVRSDLFRARKIRRCERRKDAKKNFRAELNSCGHFSRLLLHQERIDIIRHNHAIVDCTQPTRHDDTDAPGVIHAAILFGQRSADR